MNGIKYHRITLGISLSRLSGMTGISIPTLRKMEQMEIPHGVYASNYIAAAKALRVSPDDLIRNNYSDTEVQERAHYPSRTENLNNCISVYRSQKRMSFQRLAGFIGVTSRERARQACSTASPLKKHVEALAKCENISAEDFINKYSFREECA